MAPAGFRSIVLVEDGRGEGGKVLLAGMKLLCFPGVGTCLGVQVVVAEHFLKVGVIKRAVGGGVNPVLKGWRRGMSQWGGVGGGVTNGD